MKKLNEERPDWREDTVWLMDGAKMHTTEMVKDIYQKLKIPIMSPTILLELCRN